MTDNDLFYGEVSFDTSPKRPWGKWCYAIKKGIHGDLYATGTGYKSEEFARQACAGIVFRYNGAKGNFYDNIYPIKERIEMKVIIETFQTAPIRHPLSGEVIESKTRHFIAEENPEDEFHGRIFECATYDDAIKAKRFINDRSTLNVK